MGRKRNKKGAKDEGNAAEVAMEKAVQRVQAILREHSEQEIRETLLQCNLNHNVAIDRLLSQQDASNEQGASTQSTDSPTTTSSSVLLPNQSGLPNVPVSSGEAVPLSSESSSSAITNDETRSVPISSSEAAPYLPVPSTSDVTNGESRSVPISSTEIVPRLSVSSSSDITNGETRSVPISSNPSLSVPSSRALTNVTPVAEVSRGLHVPSKQNVTKKAPVKADDSPLFPFNQPMDTRQSIATASSLLGPRPPTSMATDAFGTYTSFEPHIINNQQAMNWGQVPSGQYGNVMTSPYLWPNQYDMAPFQQRGGGSNSSTLAHHGDMLSFPSRWLPHDICQSLNSVFAPYRNRTLSLSSTSTVPSSPASAYDFGNAANSRNHLPSSSIGPSSHASAYDFETSSGNAANSSGTSSIGPSSYVNGSNSRLGYGDYLPPVHLQGTSPSVWRAQGEDSYRSIPPRGQQEREAYFERIRTDLASSSLDQTQQRPKDE